MLDLTIRSPVAAPRPSESDPGVTVWRDNDGEAWAFGRSVEGEHRIDIPGLAAYTFAASSGAVIATPQPGADLSVVRDAFRRTVLPLALQALGREVLHASAVRTPVGVIPFCAVTRTGKSTFAYGMSRRGHPLWADDAVCFEVDETSITALPLPFALQLRPTSAAFFDGDGSSAESSSDASPAPLAAVFVLRRTGSGERPGGLRRLSPAESFPLTLAHAYCFTLDDRERNRRMMKSYLELASRVPAFELSFEGQLERLPSMLDLAEEAVVELGVASRR